MGFLLIITECMSHFLVFGSIKKNKWIKGKPSFRFPYLVWHEIELFWANFLCKITLSLTKLNKDSKLIVFQLILRSLLIIEKWDSFKKKLILKNNSSIEIVNMETNRASVLNIPHHSSIISQCAVWLVFLYIKKLY